MKIFRKMLFITALVLVLGLIQSLVFAQTDVFGDETELIFNVFAGGTLLLLIPFILFHKSNEFTISSDDEMMVSDDINANSDDRSLLAIVAVRSIILIVLLVALDAYINTNGIPKADGSMEPNALAYTFMSLIFLVVLPFLVFYKTPLTQIIKNSISPNTNQRRHRPSAYTVNPDNHSSDHVFEKDDYNDTTIRCPYCNSASISAYKKNDSKKFVVQGAFKNAFSQILEEGLKQKEHFVCLNCNRKW